MQLYAHQLEVLDAPDEKKRRMFLAHDTGTGKTWTILEHARRTNAPTLVICTKTGKTKWQREIQNYGLQKNVTLLTKEEFRAQASELPRFSFVAFDESHWFCGQGSLMFRQAHAYLHKHKPDYVWLASATPYTSSTWSVFQGLRLLGQAVPYQKWRKRFFLPLVMGPRVIWKQRERVEGRPIEEVIADIIREHGFVKHINDCFDVPDQLDLFEYYPRTPAQEKAIADIDEATHIAYWTAVHRAENGIAPDGRELPYEKLDRLVELAEKHEHLVVYARYVDQLKRVKDLFGERALVIDSSVPQAKRQELIDSAPAVLLIQASISDSYEVPYARAMVFLSLDFSYVHYKQAHGRLLRANNRHKNIYYHLLTEGVDAAVWDSALSGKKKFSMAMYRQDLVAL